MTKKDLNNMQSREMIRCEGCNGYHTMEESEVVIIKIIKGKGCPMPSSRNTVVEAVVPRVVYNSRDNTVPVTVNAPVAPAVPKKRIIPNAFLSAMVPPTHPGFESHGAKEFRTA